MNAAFKAVLSSTRAPTVSRNAAVWKQLLLGPGPGMRTTLPTGARTASATRTARRVITAHGLAELPAFIGCHVAPSLSEFLATFRWQALEPAQAIADCILSVWR